MSRTLKRPMFRDGGRANSKGTGIMSGIEDREPHAESNPQGVGYSQSPFKKFVVDPAKTMISPFYNVSADVGNLTKLFFGGEPTFKYLNPFAEGSGLGAELQPASQFYASSGATTPNSSNLLYKSFPCRDPALSSSLILFLAPLTGICKAL